MLQKLKLPCLDRVSEKMHPMKEYCKSSVFSDLFVWTIANRPTKENVFFALFFLKRICGCKDFYRVKDFIIAQSVPHFHECCNT